MRNNFFSLILVIFLLAISPRFVLAEVSGNISLADTGNYTVTGLTGSTAPIYCNTTSDCNGYRCYLDYDGTSSSPNSGWCYPFGYTSCMDDGTWRANGYKVCKDSNTLATCSNGDWVLTTCENGCSNGQCISSSESSSTSSLTYSIQITRTITDFNITQGESVVKIVEIKNNGYYNLTNVKIILSGISSSVFSIVPSSVPVLNISQTTNFTITFSIPSDFDVRVYNITMKANSTEAEITAKFKLKVLPSNETIEMLLPTFEQYVSILNELEINVTKLEKLGVNVSEMRELISLIREKLNQTNSSIQAGDYFNAIQFLNEAKAKIKELQNKIAEAKLPMPDILTYAIIAIIVVVIILLVYLFWPTGPGYHPKRGFSPRRNILVKEKGKTLIQKMREIVNKVRYRKM